jgi:hypothetical protein
VSWTHRLDIAQILAQLLLPNFEQLGGGVAGHRYHPVKQPAGPAGGGTVREEGQGNESRENNSRMRVKEESYGQ